MYRTKFQVESLETFSLWKVVQYVKHADLGVNGPLGPLRSVTVKMYEYDGCMWAIYGTQFRV